MLFITELRQRGWEDSRSEETEVWALSGLCILDAGEKIECRVRGGFCLLLILYNSGILLVLHLF